MKNAIFSIFLLAFVVLIECQMPGNVVAAATPPITLSAIQKLHGNLPQNTERTPIVWHNEIIEILPSGNAFSTNNTIIQINSYDLSSNALIASGTVTSNIGFYSAIVYNDIVYLFGTTGNGFRQSYPGNQIVMISSVDLINWTRPVVILQASNNVTLYNTSTTANSNGFVLVYEETVLGDSTGYHNLFLTSKDLIHWESIGTILHPNSFSACPKIYYCSSDGYYYVDYLSYIDYTNTIYYYTTICRSIDLINWQENTSMAVVLSPFNCPLWESGPTPNINNSDCSFCEYNGITYITYMYSDQTTWGNWGLAIYRGGMSSLLESFWKS